MKNEASKGIARLITAFKNSIAGFKDIWGSEEAFRQEVILLGLSVPLASWISTSVSHMGLLIGSVLMLVIVEIINSAIEAIVDRIGPEKHELSRIAKDLGSLAVLTTMLFPLTIWGASLLALFGVISF